MEPKIIAIIGTTGVGKSFLVKKLAEKLNATAILEEGEGIPERIIENIKENKISFWIEKHNRYAKLLAQEEIAVLSNNKNITLKPSLFGNPDQRILWQKKIWNGLPLYLRPFLYFIYRYFILLGFLDGKQGFVFHFLQAFWFRLLVDINIDEMRETGKIRD